MKYLNYLILLFAAVITVNAQTDRTKDETAVRGNVEQLEKGWNMKSGAEFAKPFAEDSDYVVINGAHMKGRRANAVAHQQIFDTVYKDSSLKLAVESIRFLVPGIALVHVRGTLQVRRGDPTSVVSARSTQVMKKTNGKWEISAFQNTAIESTDGRPASP